MQLVERHIIKKTHRFYQEIDRLSFLAKNLYNAAMYLYRQDFFAGRRTNAIEVYHNLKTTTDYKALPAKVSQEVLRMVLQAWTSYYQAIKSYNNNPTSFKAKPSIPRYKGTPGQRSDGRYVVSYNNQAFSKKSLKKGLINPSGTSIFVPTKVTEIEQIRFIPKKVCYVMEVVYQITEMPSPLPAEKIGAIDLGLNNLATLTTNLPEYQPKIYDGRAIKSVNQYCNKRVSQLKSLLGKKQKTSQRIKRLWQKRNQQVDYYLHCTSSAIISELVNHQIGSLIIGWNSQFKDSINIGRVNNQNFVSVPHYRLIEQLKYKGALAGIEVKTVEESYTSKCSALDLEPLEKQKKYRGKRVKRGLFKTEDSRLINADLNGAMNIGRKVVGNDFIISSDSGCVAQPVRIRPYQAKV